MFTLFENDQNSTQLYEYLLNVFPAWAKVVNWVKPYTLPTDYLFFQCFYSGLNIVTTNYDFWLNGAGPLVNEAYFPLMGDTAWTEPSRDGLLTLGDMENFTVSEDDECYCTFLLDLAQVFAHQKRNNSSWTDDWQF